MIRIPNRTLGVLSVALCVSAAALTTAYAATPESPTAPATGKSAAGDTTAPPRPVITSRPPSPTTVTSATFAYTDAEAGVTFQCRLDGKGAFTSCGSSVTYKALTPRTHLFEVRAIDKARNTSAVASFRWTIQRKVSKFSIRGTVTDPLFPGGTSPVNVTVSNPYPFTIVVRDVIVTPQAATTKGGKPNPACDGLTNLRVAQYSGKPFSVQPNRTVTLAGMNIAEKSWPQVTMVNLPTSQDGCRGTTYAFTYSATATKR